MNQFEFAYYFAAIVSAIVLIVVHFVQKWNSKQND